MTDKVLRVAVEYVKHASAVAHVRPYANTAALSNGIDLGLQLEALPEEGHSRVELSVTVTARNTEGVLCFESSCAIEAIVVTQGLTPEELDQSLRFSVAPALMGSARTLITNLSANTGYGPLVLPPIEAAKIAALAPAVEVSDIERNQVEQATTQSAAQQQGESLLEGQGAVPG